MSVHVSQLIRDLRADFEHLLHLVIGAQAQTASLDQMECSLLRYLLLLGRKLLAVFLAGRMQAEAHTPC